MPWQESCAMDERIGFIGEHTSGLWTMTELCERYGISRKTGYKWLGRYREAGAAGLAARSSAPLAHGRATPEALTEAIVALRRERPSWGPRKIVARLAALQPGIAWPSASTVGEILKRAGLVNGRRPKRRVPPRAGGLTTPLYAHHVWCADHKGWVRLLDGGRAEPLTITDGFSRYLIGLAATSGTTQGQARPVFEQAFAEHGLPEAIRSDNGVPFASTGVTGLTSLSVWWIKLGIRHERIDPGRPQQNGAHERFHLTLKEAMHPPAESHAAQEARFAAFARAYNEERPHEALGQEPPARFYAASPRPLPDRLPEPDYQSEAAVRKVRSNGEIKWGGELVHICSALAGEAVALEETAAGDWRVRFFDTPLGIIDASNRKLRRPAVPVHGNSRADPETRP
jgi:putative transposase